MTDPLTNIDHILKVPTTGVEIQKMFKYVPGYNADFAIHQEYYQEHRPSLYNPLSVNANANPLLLMTDAGLSAAQRTQQPKLNAFDHRELADLFTELWYNGQIWSTTKVNDEITRLRTAIKATNPTMNDEDIESRASEQFVLLHAKPPLHYLINKTFRDEMTIYDDNFRHMEKPFRECYAVFQKLGGTNLAVYRKFVDAKDFHGAYNAINLHYANSAFNQINLIEEDILKLRVKSGAVLATHKEEVTIMLQYLVDVYQLSYEQRSNPGTYHLYQLNKELTDDNVGIMTDTEIRAKWCNPPYNHKQPVFLREEIRINYFITSFEDSRYKHIIEDFWKVSSSNRTMKLLMKILENFESSPTCIKAIRDEIKNKHEEKKEAPKAPVAANETIIGGNKNKTAKTGSYPVGSCTNHPLSTTHTTQQCSGKKKESKETKTKDAEPAKDSKKRPWTERHCDDCAKSKEDWKKKNSHTHDTKNCRFKLTTATAKTTANVSDDTIQLLNALVGLSKKSMKKKSKKSSSKDSSESDGEEQE
jgi:hypothetical protein